MRNVDRSKAGALWAIGQGILTAVAPQLSVKMFKRMIGKNFENAESLEAKPGYLRQLRAIGIGFAAAGIASYVIERVESSAADDADDAADADADDAE